MKVSAGFLKKGIVPEIEKWYNPQFLKEQDFVTNATLYFGIGWEEAPIQRIGNPLMWLCH